MPMKRKRALYSRPIRPTSALWLTFKPVITSALPQKGHFPTGVPCCLGPSGVWLPGLLKVVPLNWAGGSSIVWRFTFGLAHYTSLGGSI